MPAEADTRRDQRSISTSLARYRSDGKELHAVIHGKQSTAKLPGLTSPDTLAIWPDEGHLIVANRSGAWMWAVRLEKDGAFGPGDRSWMDLLYLSFTTLSSTGLSDIQPVTGHARSVIMLEQVVGIFYIAMVVTRLVSLRAERRRV